MATFLICFGWNKKMEAAPAAACGSAWALVISRKRSLPLAAQPAVLVISLLKLPLLVVQPTSRKKSLLLAVQPVVLATSKPFHALKSCSRRERSRREHLDVTRYNRFYIKRGMQYEAIFFFSMAHYR